LDRLYIQQPTQLYLAATPDTVGVCKQTITRIPVSIIYSMVALLEVTGASKQVSDVFVLAVGLHFINFALEIFPVLCVKLCTYRH
jgi:hypothetical protein